MVPSLLLLMMTLQVGAGVSRPSIVVTQGAAASGAQEFHSPMVLEVSLADLLEAEPGEEVEVRGVRQYICDDVALFTLKLRLPRPSKAEPALVVSGLLRVRPSYDRRTSLRFDIYAEEARLSTPSLLNRLKTEEGRVKEFEARLPLTAAEAARLVAAPDARLRIEMAVFDDD